jgi:hypothetical protein
MTHMAKEHAGKPFHLHNEMALPEVKTINQEKHVGIDAAYPPNAVPAQ